MIALYEDQNRAKVKSKKLSARYREPLHRSGKMEPQPSPSPRAQLGPNDSGSQNKAWSTGFVAKFAAQFVTLLANTWASYKQNRTDRLALNQLMQLDDSLLKDMGLTRSELSAIKNGTLSFDALVKKDIQSNRDSSCSSTYLRRR